MSILTVVLLEKGTLALATVAIGSWSANATSVGLSARRSGREAGCCRTVVRGSVSPWFSTAFAMVLHGAGVARMTLQARYACVKPPVAAGCTTPECDADRPPRGLG